MKQAVIREAAWSMMSLYFGMRLDDKKNKHEKEQLCALGGIIKRQIIDVQLALPLISPDSGGAHILIPGERWLYAMQVFKQCDLALIGS